jgi:hypothetical protein
VRIGLLFIHSGPIVLEQLFHPRVFGLQLGPPIVVSCHPPSTPLEPPVVKRRGGVLKILEVGKDVVRQNAGQGGVRGGIYVPSYSPIRAHVLRGATI